MSEALDPLRFRDRLHETDLVLRTGRVRKIFGTHITATGPNVSLGTICEVQVQSGGHERVIPAEVVRIDDNEIVLSPLVSEFSTWSGALVTAAGKDDQVSVGDAYLGRVVNPMGKALDGKGSINGEHRRPLLGEDLLPLERLSPHEQLVTGIRAIDGMLTLGKGQRLGVFAASGVGKTTLMNQIARQARADVTVICLVGERGQEVEALWNNGLDDQAKARTTVVAATSDQSAAVRVRCGHYALALAEHWRAQGKHVLFLLDSATRLAMAMREIGLSAGEPPTIRAYTPSVFAAIPRIVERCGALKSGGEITAVMTVLSETDDMDDPISEMMKSLLDGHILLSRTLAEQGHYPAIDINRSISRHAYGLVPEAMSQNARRLLECLSLHERSRTLIETGLYSAGSNKAIDAAIQTYPEIAKFLQQERGSFSDLDRTFSELSRIAMRISVK